MSLSCTCQEAGSDPGDWWFMIPNDFSIFTGTKKGRRRRCSSCGQLIDIGALCLEFYRERAPYTDLEMEIVGEEVPMTPLNMCEQCGEIYLNLDAIGYCLDPTDDMKDCLSEYHELTGFDPEKWDKKELHYGNIQ